MTPIIQYYSIMIYLHDQPNKKSHKKADLSEQEKLQCIKKIRNYPHLTQSNQQLLRKKQSEVLSQLYPWGCSKLIERAEFDDHDRIYQLWFPDYSNICISLKYGVCPIFKLANFKFIYQEWKKYEENGRNGNVYLKLVDEDKIYALVRLVNLRFDVSFKFWYVLKGMQYPIGLGFIEAISVGQISRNMYSGFQHSNLKRLYRELRDNQLNWTKFKASDDYEWIGRMRYIDAIKKSQMLSLQRKLEERNKQMMQQLQK